MSETPMGYARKRLNQEIERLEREAIRSDDEEKAGEAKERADALRGLMDETQVQAMDLDTDDDPLGFRPMGDPETSEVTEGATVLIGRETVAVNHQNEVWVRADDAANIILTTQQERRVEIDRLETEVELLRQALGRAQHLIEMAASGLSRDSEIIALEGER